MRAKAIKKSKTEHTCESKYHGWSSGETKTRIIPIGSMYVISRGGIVQCWDCQTSFYHFEPKTGMICHDFFHTTCGRNYQARIDAHIKAGLVK